MHAGRLDCVDHQAHAVERRRLRGHDANRVVVGRPVHLSTATDDADDEFALRRLLDAVEQCGFEEILVEYEPVAAAYSYERLERWHHLSFFNNDGHLDVFERIRRRASSPEQIEAFIDLIRSEAGYQLHEAVRRTKFALSSQEDPPSCRRFGASSWIGLAVRRSRAGRADIGRDRSGSASRGALSGQLSAL